MTALAITGVTLGTIYALMGLGLTLVYGVTKVFNYAQGAFFTWSAYFAWLLHTGYFELNYPLAIAITMILMFFFGMGFERVLIYPLRRSGDWGFTALIVTLGSALFLDNLALVVFGPRHKTLPYLMAGSFSVGGIMIPKHNVLMLIATMVIVVLLVLFLNKTREGMAMRAISQDLMGANIVGIQADRTYGFAFGLAAVLAAISSIFLTPRVLIYPYGGWPILIRAFVVTIFGGLGSFYGTLAAAFIMGIIEALTTHLMGPIWSLPVFLIVLVIVLIFRPRGLLGR